jgi:hypothetical protein
MNEKLVVERLRDQLTSRFRKILSHQNLANLPKLKSVLVDYFGYLPVLNEVDMILVGHEGELCAIEVKYFTIRDGGFDRPFYDGIGQSLSLLRYGFDSVALWHVFSADINQKRLDRYGAATWWFIRNQTRIPLAFTYFRIKGDPQAPQFVVMQYKGPNIGAELLPIDCPNFEITWKIPNPFRQTDEGKILRNAVVAALEIGDIVSG